MCQTFVIASSLFIPQIGAVASFFFSFFEPTCVRSLFSVAQALQDSLQPTTGWVADSLLLKLWVFNQNGRFGAEI